MTEAYKTYEREVKATEDLTGVPLLVQMTRVIDAARAADDMDAVAEWNSSLLRAGSHFGRFDYELRGFAGLKQLYESDARFADLKPQLLWYYKWLVERLPEQADTSREMIAAVFAQMAAFYEAEGESLRPVYELRCRAESFMGNVAAADDYAAKWDATEKGASDDCPACETHNRVQYLLHVGRTEEALQAAEILIEGKQQCEEVPTTTFSRLLMPVLFSGDAGLAEAMQRSTVRHVRKVPKLLSYLANHVMFLSIIGRAPEADRLAFVMLSRADGALNDYDRMTSCRAGWAWLTRRSHLGLDDAAVPKALAARHGLTRDSRGRVPIAALAPLLRDDAQSIAQAFDRRNGNGQTAEGLANLESVLTRLASAGR